MKALIPILAATAALTVSGSITAAGTDPTTTPTTSRARTEVTSGTFQTLPGGTDLGYDVRGRAMMIRFGGHHDQTVVGLRIRGLAPDTSYPTHVHNQPCSATPAGGSHYQHDVNGPVDAVNEMWPTITTNNRGMGFGYATHAHRARPEAQSIVVHNPLNTSIRLACVDLG